MGQLSERTQEMKKRLWRIAASVLLAGSMIPSIANAAPADVTAASEPGISNTNPEISPRSPDRCNTTRKTYLRSGYTTAPAHSRYYNDCWLKIDTSTSRIATTYLQRNALGFTGSKADGVFGKDTRSALIVKQRNAGFTGSSLDGIYGWKTGKAITWKNQAGRWYVWS